jgi:citrate lyase subunit beta / citryl-CoA lyase
MTNKIGDSGTYGVVVVGAGNAGLCAALAAREHADYVRSKLVIASAAAGLRPPIDTVYPSFKDTAGLQFQAQLARSLGMGGKFCVHPSQIEVVNRVFQQQPEELQTARKLLTGYDQATRRGKGATSIEGVMVDEAGFKRARRLLERQPPKQR